MSNMGECVGQRRPKSPRWGEEGERQREWRERQRRRWERCRSLHGLECGCERERVGVASGDAMAGVAEGGLEVGVVEELLEKREWVSFGDALRGSNAA